jgi:hypothetical protein
MLRTTYIAAVLVVLVIVSTSGAFVSTASQSWERYSHCAVGAEIGPSTTRTANKKSHKILHMSTEDDEDDSKESKTTQTSLKLIDVQFDPVPQEENNSSGDLFTYVLLAYVVFAVSDSIFHFIPNDKTYVEMIKDAIVGATTDGTGGTP